MTKNVLTMAASAAVLTNFATAGDFTETLEAPAAVSSFCDYLTGGVKLYKDSSNPFIQEVSFFGRAQYQVGYADGSAELGDFSGYGDNLRRLRVGTKIKFLQDFELKVNANLTKNNPRSKNAWRNPEFGYSSLDEAKLTYKAGDVAGFEGVKVSYGRHKHTLSGESHHSSKKLKTVERSNIANYFYDSSRPSGLTLSGVKGNYEIKLGLYSAIEAKDELTGDYGETAYYLNVQNGGWNFDLFFNGNDDSNENEFENVDWGTSLAYETEVAGWDLFLNGIYGENNDGADVYGLVIMPSKFIIEDKLEAVFRYQFAGASEDALNAGSSSRGIRAIAKKDGVSTSKGDKNHTIYAGLNYYFCGHNSKAQFGVEHETLKGDGEDLDGTTIWAAYRMYF